MFLSACQVSGTVNTLLGGNEPTHNTSSNDLNKEIEIVFKFDVLLFTSLGDYFFGHFFCSY